ncbi:MAG TPA: polysaccharide biosynthesis tyrosine autokinase [Glaciibacter sp.]|nr:polysaccharide biosynthesis tyrosine autokinase [Glaciibacter sp.]
MELNKLGRILRKSWILIVSFMLLGAAGGAIASLLTPVQYASSTQMFVAVAIEPGSTSGDLVQGNNFAAQKVASYVTVVTSARVLDPVIDELNLDTTAEDLARQVTATVEPLSVVMQVDALAESPSAATKLARAISASFTNVVVNEIEKPIDGSPSPVKVETLQPAVPPEDPALPQVPLNIAIGAAVGLVIGVLVAIALGFSDRRVHGRADLESLTTRPVLGAIVSDPHAKRRPLIVQEDPRSARAEAFRTLRTNLQFVGVDGETRSLVVTSSVPGEGKTTTAANLAIVLAEGGASVLLLDADLRAPRVAKYLGIEGAVGLTDVLVGRFPLADVVQAWGPRRELHVLPAGRIPPNPSDLLGSQAMSDLIDTVAGTYDYVLIDAPPVLPVTDAAVLSTVTSGVLLVVGAGRVKETEVRASLEALETVGATPVGIVLTMLPTRGPDASPYGGAGAYAMKEDKVELDSEDVPIGPSGPAPHPVATGPVAHRSSRAPAPPHPDVAPDAVSAARPNN